MITADTSKLEKQLAEYKLQVERKLKHMVTSFAHRIADYAISKTPIGDSVKYAGFYQARTDLPQVEGLAQGNWQFSHSPNGNLQLIAGQGSGGAALDILETKAASYKLGDTFYILNPTPYIGMLENNYSRQTGFDGISEPTIALVMSTYSIDLKHYYDQG